MGETIAVDNNISANVQNILMNLVTSHQYPGLLWFYGVDYTFQWIYTTKRPQPSVCGQNYFSSFLSKTTMTEKLNFDYISQEFTLVLTPIANDTRVRKYIIGTET